MTLTYRRTRSCQLATSPPSPLPPQKKENRTGRNFKKKLQKQITNSFLTRAETLKQVIKTPKPDEHYNQERFNINLYESS